MNGVVPVFLTMDQCLNLDRGYLVTVNMQHIYEARRSPLAAWALFGDPHARHCLDGRGAATLFRRVTSEEAQLVQGNMLLDRWLQRADGGRLLVIGSSETAVRKVTGAYPRIDTVVDERIIRIASVAEAVTVADELAQAHSGPWNLIAIALGVPKQELLAQALQYRMAAPIYCIGGSFEILADAFPRSPRWIQAVGMEGVWRLLLEPSTKRVERLLRSYATFFALRGRAPTLGQLTGGEN